MTLNVGEYTGPPTTKPGEINIDYGERRPRPRPLAPPRRRTTATADDDRHDVGDVSDDRADHRGHYSAGGCGHHLGATTTVTAPGPPAT